MPLVVASSFSLTGGCMLLDMRAQQARMRQACAISGQVTAARPDANSLVVVLVARDQEQGGTPDDLPGEMVAITSSGVPET